MITGKQLRDAVISGANSILKNRKYVDDLNIFPVPDGDTGTNMSMTIGTAVTELRKSEPTTVEQAASVTASALLRGARGNSGVILSLLFRGLSKALKGRETADAAAFAAAMQEGVSAAYKAVMKPAEGTILTVSRLTAARAADAARPTPPPRRPSRRGTQPPERRTWSGSWRTPSEWAMPPWPRPPR